MDMTLQSFRDAHMKKAGRFVPARLQAALALLERLRESPSLTIGDHLASKGSSGLESHETYGNRAHERLGIEPLNKNHGRRSSNLQDWGQELLDVLKAEGFETATAELKTAMLDRAQHTLSKSLREILQQDPLIARTSGRSAEIVIRELLAQAEQKNKTGDVAQYLVGAKLMMRFGREIPVRQANKGDRKSHADQRPSYGDYEMPGAVIEVAVGLPDDKHIAQVIQILEETDYEVWLLSRAERVATWKVEIEGNDDIDGKRVVVTSVEAFIGQNITEMGEFSAKRKSEQLHALFDLYNNRWVAAVGTPGIRIVTK